MLLGGERGAPFVPSVFVYLEVLPGPSLRLQCLASAVFMALLVLFIVAFGVASEAVLFPTRSNDYQTFAAILYRSVRGREQQTQRKLIFHGEPTE